MNLLQQMESGMGCPDWHTAMHTVLDCTDMCGSTALDIPESAGMYEQIGWQVRQT